MVFMGVAGAVPRFLAWSCLDNRPFLRVLQSSRYSVHSCQADDVRPSLSVAPDAARAHPCGSQIP
jgi:hypothetical protein